MRKYRASVFPYDYFYFLSVVRHNNCYLFSV